MPVFVRFAPSPTGFIHIGNVRTAVINWLFARKHNGKFLFRIDDTDKTRSTDEYVNALYEDMHWLGLNYDAFAKQSERIHRYNSAMQYLIEIGRLYPCFETAEELERKRKILLKKNKPPIYDRASLGFSNEDIKLLEAEGKKPHWRFLLNDSPATWQDIIKGKLTVKTTESFSDPILVKEDGTFLYTLSSVVDDIDFNITHIIRGEDHVTNTAVQIQLFEALKKFGSNQGQEAVKFAHLSLLFDKEGQPLSKRINSFCLRTLRQEGFDAMALNCFIAELGSSKQQLLTYDLHELAKDFDIDCIRGGARVDMATLQGIQNKMLHIKPYENAKDSFVKFGVTFSEKEWLVVRESLNTENDIVIWHNVLHGNIKVQKNEENIAYLKEVAKLLPSPPFDEKTWEQWAASIKNVTSKTGRNMIHPIRIALTGEENGPEMKKLIPIMKKNIIESRLLS